MVVELGVKGVVSLQWYPTLPLQSRGIHGPAWGSISLGHSLGQTQVQFICSLSCGGCACSWSRLTQRRNLRAGRPEGWNFEQSLEQLLLPGLAGYSVDQGAWAYWLCELGQTTSLSLSEGKKPFPVAHKKPSWGNPQRGSRKTGSQLSCLEGRRWGGEQLCFCRIKPT